MSEPVIVKSNRNGITLILDDTLTFDALLTEIEKKFIESAAFFKDAAVAVSFYGRELTPQEEIQIVNTITANCSLNIICILDYDKLQEEVIARKLSLLTEAVKPKPEKVPEKKPAEKTVRNGQFYRGTLHTGQVLECETSIILLGDVEEGSRIISKGNIVILGALRGNAHAGAAGNRKAFIAALDFCPSQLRIAEISLRPGSATRTGLKFKKRKDAQIAIAKDKTIYVEPITKGFLNNI